MATTYPGTLDTFVNPQATDQVSVVDHALQHQTINGAVAALETKVGITNSLDTSSLDYKLQQVTDRAVGLTATQTLTNKTLTAPVVTSPTTTGTDTGTETMTNKTLTDPTNTVTATGLRTATTTVSISGSTAPTTGYVLTATSSTAATWQPAGTGTWSQTDQTASRSMGTVYQNTTGKTMRVTVTGTTAGGGPEILTAFIGATSSPSTVYSGFSTNTGTSGEPMTVTMTVPNTWYYLAQNTLRGGSVTKWWRVTMPY